MRGTDKSGNQSDSPTHAGNVESGSQVMERLLSSEIKLELLGLFHSNPGLIDKIEGVALRVGRNANEIETDVRDLCDIGVLASKKIGGSEVVCLDLTRDKQVQNLIAEAMKASSQGGAE